MKHWLLGCVVCCLWMGCTSEGWRPLLDRAEALMQDSPTEARALLDTIPGYRIKQPALRARYALLYTQALDKSYIDVADDSLSQLAVSYYAEHGAVEKQASALYYHARVLMNGGDTGAAVRYLVEAEMKAREVDDRRLLGLINSSLGNLYAAQYGNEKALLHYCRAEECFRQLGERCNQAYLLENIGRMHCLLKHYDDAVTAFRKAKELYIAEGKTELGLHSASSMVVSLLERGERVDSVKKWLRNSYALYGCQKIPVSDYGVWLDLHLREQCLDSARIYGRLIRNHSTAFSPRHLVGFYAQFAKVEYQAGNYLQAYRDYKRSRDIIDSLDWEYHQTTIRAIERRYENQLLEQQCSEMKLRNRFQRVVLVLVVILFLVGTYTAWRRFSRWRKRAADILQQVRLDLHHLEHSYAEISADYQQVKIQLNEADERERGLCDALEERLKALKRLIAKTQHVPNSSFIKLFKEEFAVDTYSKTALNDLQYVVNYRYCGIIDHLKKRYPELSKHDLDLCALLCFGFSQYAICYLYGYGELATYYNKRSRLRHRLHLPSDYKLEDFIREELKQLRLAQGNRGFFEKNAE